MWNKDLGVGKNVTYMIHAFKLELLRRSYITFFKKNASLSRTCGHQKQSTMFRVGWQSSTNIYPIVDPTLYVPVRVCMTPEKQLV